MAIPFASPSSSSSSSPNLYQASSRKLLKRRARGLSAKTTCIHPQLRDLLTCPSEAGSVVGHSYHTLCTHVFATKHLPSSAPRRDHLQALNFIPNVVASGCGLVAAGGHTAELALRSADKSSTWCVQTLVGKSINNSIHIAPSPSHPLSVPRVLVSNNDRCVYRYELHFPKRWGTMEFTDEYGDGVASSAAPELLYVDRIKLDTAVNHTSVSPDGRTMVCVGDTNEAFIFDINAHGHTRLIDTMQISEDASFSTSWSRTGEHFAVASQDGVVSVVDRRYLRPMKRFQTYQSGEKGAARVVKYSQGPHELLAFSEQRSYIHVVDARTYEYVERIHLPSVELEDHARVDSNPNISDVLRGLTRLPSRPPSQASDNPWDTYPDTVTPSWRDCPPPHDAFRRSAGLSPSLPSSSLSPRYGSDRSFSSTPSRPARYETVASVLGGTDDPSSSIPTFGGFPGPAGYGSNAITGLDWDPTGKYLYASMEKIILEWQVDSDSRRCHPHASIL